MADFDFDDLINTGLEDVSKTKIESSAITINSVVGSKKGINYQKVEQIKKESPAGSVEENTIIKPKSSLSSSLSSPMKASSPSTLLKSSSPMGLMRQDKFIKAKPIADELKEFFGIADPFVPSGSESLYLQMDKIKSSDKILELIEERDLNCAIKEDPWTSVSIPFEKWTDKPVNQEESIVDIRCQKENGFHLEIDTTSVTVTGKLQHYDILDLDLDIPVYQEFFKGHIKTRYYIDTVTKSLLIVNNSTKNQRAILKTPTENIRCIVPYGVDPLKYEPAFPPSGQPDKQPKPKLVGTKYIPKLEAELESIETMAIIKRYKFGVICVKDGQNDENDWFANDECCPEFWEFMNLIGERIELQGYTGYRGGLDVTKGCTGKESYVKKYRNIWEIMFHVAPLLPNQQDDLQKLERKRHVGNDMVVIVFLEPNRKEPFDPRILTSHFNNVFFIIQPKKKDGVDGYCINIATKSDVLPFPPFMKTSWMRKDHYFAEWMLKKLINSERMTMYNNTFSRNTKNTRRQQMDQLIEALQQN